MINEKTLVIVIISMPVGLLLGLLAIRFSYWLDNWLSNKSYIRKERNALRLKYGKYDGDNYSKCMDELHKLSDKELNELYDKRREYNITDRLRIGQAMADRLTEEDERLHPVGNGRIWTCWGGDVSGEPVIRLGANFPINPEACMSTAECRLTLEEMKKIADGWEV